MRRLATIYLVLLAGLLLLGAGKKETKPAGSEVQKAVSPVNSQAFCYYVPAAAKGKKKVPFVLSYHGASGSGEGEIGSWTKLADQYGFIVACPTSNLAGANAKPAVPFSVNPQDFIKEIETILSIVKFMHENCSIDGRRQMITGFSGGGVPTYWFGLLHPQVFRFVCPRSGNFPKILKNFYGQNPDAKKYVDLAAQKSYIYLFYGDKDHPLILKEAPESIDWINSLKPAHFKTEVIAGGGHSSLPAKAAEWFMGALKEAEPEFEAEAKEAYPQLLAAANEAKGKGELGKALEQFRAAAAIEEEYPKLGKVAAKEVADADRAAKALLIKVKSLKMSQKDQAAAALQELLANYPGTDAAKEGEKLLPELPKPAAP